eukprot:TRINITY_DN105581_c0_g1_i1.p1 TRINITY_DN105581_c0_g1~~TRINITY_DN105581_c0_g1_i1.p1  ORF type:complete len:275 (-),score=46.96 TRINITY_DN105581_c0_g1_i1:28-852(-)
MEQLGAALTDWGVAATCFAGLLLLSGGSDGRRLPRWYKCVMGVYLSEGLACFAGGFMWASGANKHANFMGELSWVSYAACCPMILGMAAEGIFLILASRALSNPCEDTPFLSWARLEMSCLAVCSALYFMGCWLNMSFTLTYQFLAPLAFGLAKFLLECIRAYQRSAAASLEASCWLRVLAGAALNMLGAAVLGLLDNDCTGIRCITEPLPWESSPCRYGTAVPPGSSCPLPEWFNHAAAMHVLAIFSAILAVPSLLKLRDLPVEVKAQKSRTQ